MKKRIGEILIDAGVVTESIIETALEKKSEGVKIGDYLVEKGFVREDVLYEKLSEQLKTPLFKLSETNFKSDILDLIDKDTLRKNVSFPIEKSGSLLTVAMADPLDSDSLLELEKASEMDISAVLGKKSEILDYINKYYEIDDSIQDLFNISDNDFGDTNEMQVADKLISKVNEKGNLTLVISKVNSKTEVLMGDSNGYSSKDLDFLLGFVKKVTNFKNTSSEAVMDYKEDIKIKLSLIEVNKGLHKQYWIEASTIKKENHEDLYHNKLDVVQSNGLYIVLNPSFEKENILLDSIVNFNQKLKDSFILCTDNVDYEKYGIKTINNKKMDIKLLSNFSKSFMFLEGWNKEQYDDILYLLNKNKIVLIQLPLKDNEDLEKYISLLSQGSGEEYILSKLIKYSIVL